MTAPTTYYNILLTNAIIYLTSFYHGVEAKCDPMKGTQCLTEYRYKFIIGAFDSTPHMCGKIKDYASKLRMCVRDAGCEGSSEIKYEEMITQFQNAYNNILCNPSTQCSLLEAFRCYDSAFELHASKVPTDQQRTAIFTDTVRDSLIFNEGEECRAMQDVDFTKMAMCVREKFDTISRNCIGTGTSKDQLTEDLRHFLKSTDDAEKIKKYIDAQCEGECPDFKKRIEGIAKCFEKYEIRMETLDESNQDAVCNVAGNTHRCLETQTSGCDVVKEEFAAQDDFILNRHTCGISATALPIAHPGLIFVSMMFVIFNAQK